ncbi:hypothetical protein [Hippea jasoniae]|uniref:hypothetical protein n=1 Tax=Hippea jasoniae TaxID=944479 RepID=UPI0005584718|nr:hypothetical protein [Hippea jasoniae]
MRYGRFYLLFLSFFLILSAAAINPQPTYSESANFPTVEPMGEQPVSYGWGYDTRKGSFKTPCVVYDRNSIQEMDNEHEHTVFKLVQTNYDMAKESNLSVNASLKILTTTTYQANDKLSIIGGTKTSTFNQSLYATAYLTKPSYIDISTIQLKDRYKQLLSQPGGLGEFRQRCGDTFVIGVVKGREFLGVATVKKQTLKSWTKFANEANISAKGAWGNAKVGTQLAKTMERAFGSNQIEIKTYSTGSSMTNPTTIDELTDYYKNFLKESGGKRIIKYVLMPYSMLEDFPAQNPLQATSKEEYIGILITSLWDLKGGIEDANMVLSRSTQELFALGTINRVRNMHIQTIKAYKRMWIKEFNMLIKATKMCNKNFTKKCQKLAEYYKNYRNFYDEWDAVMPEKYLSDCKTPIILPDAALQKLKSTIEYVKQQRVHGDAEGGGGSSKTRIVVVMNVKPDGRRLKAYISLARIEWKRKRSKRMPIVAKMKGESAWALMGEAVIFDLDHPAEYGVQIDSNLKYCTFNRRSRGIKTPLVRHIPPAAGYFARYGFKTRRSYANGYIDEMTGRGPRGDQTFGNGLGTLDYIVCEADRKGKDDNLVCKKIVFKQIQLDLVSTQDLKANRFKPPKKPYVPQQLTNFIYGRNIVLAKRIMRTSGSMSKAARLLQRNRLKAIRNFGTIRLNIKNLKLKNNLHIYRPKNSY